MDYKRQISRKSRGFTRKYISAYLRNQREIKRTKGALLYTSLRIFFLLCIMTSIFICRDANAQTFEEWVRVVNDKAISLDNVKVTVKIKAINKEDDEEVYSTSISIMRSGRKFYYQMEDIEIVNDGRYQVTANHGFRTISFFKMDDEFLRFQPEIMSLDSILRYYSDPVKMGEDDQYVKYKVNQKNSLVSEVFISIDKKQKEIDMIAYDYDADPGDQEDHQNRVEMKFITTALSDSGNRYFDINKYLKIEKGKGARLADAYEGYYLEKIN